MYSGVVNDQNNAGPRRFTISVSPQVDAALDVALRLTGYKQNDAAGLAIQLGALVLQTIYSGDHVLLRNHRTGDIERVHPLMPVCNQPTPAGGVCVLPAGHPATSITDHQD